jgi:hypothetical protein
MYFLFSRFRILKGGNCEDYGLWRCDVLQSDRSLSFTLKMEVAGSSETRTHILLLQGEISEGMDIAIDSCYGGAQFESQLGY